MFLLIDLSILLFLALSNQFGILSVSIRNNKKRYEETFNYLKRKGFDPIPSVTNFICFQTDSEVASNYLFEELLNRGVIIRPLKGNKLSDWVIISLGTKEEMRHLFDAMDEVMYGYHHKFRAK